MPPPPGLSPSGDFTSMLLSTILLAFWLFDAAKFYNMKKVEQRRWKNMIPIGLLLLTLVVGALAQTCFLLVIWLNRGFNVPEMISLVSNGFGAVYGLFALGMVYGSITTFMEAAKSGELPNKCIRAMISISMIIATVPAINVAIVLAIGFAACFPLAGIFLVLFLSSAITFYFAAIIRGLITWDLCEDQKRDRKQQRYFRGGGEDGNDPLPIWMGAAAGGLVAILYAAPVYWLTPGKMYDFFFDPPNIPYLLHLIAGFPWRFNLHELDLFQMLSLQSLVGIASTVLRFLGELCLSWVPDAVGGSVGSSSGSSSSSSSWSDAQTASA